MRLINEPIPDFDEEISSTHVSATWSFPAFLYILTSKGALFKVIVSIFLPKKIIAKCTRLKGGLREEDYKMPSFERKVGAKIEASLEEEYLHQGQF